MAEGSRPPSEQGPEYRTLDAIEQLTAKVDELARQRGALTVHGNWWDVLGVPEGYEGFRWRDIFSQGWGVSYLLQARQNQWLPELRVMTFDDRLELQLRVQGGWIVWQRALFFHQGPRG